MAKPKRSDPKLTDAERLARFKEMAREVGADESPDTFEDAFKRVVRPSEKSDPPH